MSFWESKNIWTYQNLDHNTEIIGSLPKSTNLYQIQVAFQNFQKYGVRRKELPVRIISGELKRSVGSTLNGSLKELGNDFGEFCNISAAPLPLTYYRRRLRAHCTIYPAASPQLSVFLTNLLEFAPSAAFV